MPDRNQVLYEFGGFYLDVKQRTLARSGCQIVLTSKVFDTLLLLVQNSGQLVKKEEMMTALWPESFVEEGNLTQNISVLRRALGNGPNGEALIQTIPRQGYRFVAQVRQIDMQTPANGRNGAGEFSGSANYWTLHSPFRGLQVFEPEDAWLFFGRDADINELGERLYRAPVLAVVGNSGSGKSSLVRAGLIAALQQGRLGCELPLVDSWRIVLSRPTHSPFDYLAEILPGALAPSLDSRERAEFIADCKIKFPLDKDALRNAICASLIGTAEDTSRTRVLLIVDQFEEIFTLSSSQDTRTRYIDALLSACQIAGPAPTHLLLVLRADFYANCLEHRELSCRLETNLFNVPRMGLEQLRESVEKRLTLASVHAEPGLVDTLLTDVGTEPGNLALLEHALSQLWKKCGGHGGTLTRQAYLEIGGLQGSLSKHADEVYREIGDEHLKSLMQKIFLELVRLGEGTRDTGRRVRKTDLLALGGPGEVEPLLTKLAASRLISVGRERDETFVEVSHETLIRKWPALREWLAQNRDELRLERRLMQAASEWAGFDKEPGALLQGARLFQAEEWVARHTDAPALLLEFVQLSIQARDEAARKEQEVQQLALARQQTQLKLEAEKAHAVAALEKSRAADQASATRRLHRMVIFLLVAVICACGAAAVAWAERRQAKRNERLAQESAAAAQTGRREAETAKLFAQSKEHEAEAARRDAEAARAEINGNLQIAKQLRAEAESSRQMAILLQQAAQQQDRSIYEDLKADRELVARVTRERDEAMQQLQTVRANMRALENSLKTSPETGPPATAQVPPVAASSASEVAGDALSMRLTRDAGQNLERDSHLSVWLALYALKAAKSAPIRHDAEMMLRRAVWKAQALPVIEITANEGHIAGIEFSRDNTRIMTLKAGRQKQVDVWDVKSGHLLASLMAAHGYVVSATFSADSRHIALSASDGTTKLWDMTTWQPQPGNLRDNDTIYLNSLGANGRLLVSAGRGPLLQSAVSGSWVHLWDASSSKASPLILTPRFLGPVTAIAFNDDSTLLALGSKNGDVALYDVTSGKATPAGDYLSNGTLRAIRKIVFSPDARKLAALDSEGNAVIWSLSSGHYFRGLPGKPHGFICDVAFSSDGRLLAAIAMDRKNKFAILDLESGEQVDLNAIDAGVRSHWTSALSHDAQLLAISGPSRRRLRIYARDTAQLVDFAEQNAHRKLTSAECLLYLQQMKCLPMH